jgi:tRNA threonylcarbamoyl adenosine modification protein YjeE
MPSPTYNLLFTYDIGARVVHHLDLYRLEDPEDVWELGWEELGRGEEIVLIEWPERAESLLPPDRWDVRLAAVPGRAGLRSLTLERLGDAPSPVPLADAPSDTASDGTRAREGA